MKRFSTIIISVVTMLLALTLLSASAEEAVEMNEDLTSTIAAFLGNWEWILIAVSVVLCLFLPEETIVFVWLGTAAGVGGSLIVSAIKAISNGATFEEAFQIGGKMLPLVFCTGVLGNRLVHEERYHSVFERLGVCMGGLIPVVIAQIAVICSDTITITKLGLSTSTLRTIIFGVGSLMVFPVFKQWCLLIPCFVTALIGMVNELIKGFSPTLEMTVGEAINQFNILSIVPAAICLGMIIAGLVLIRRFRD